VLSPIDEVILLCVAKGMSIREIAAQPQLPSRNAIHERLQSLETAGYTVSPHDNTERWRLTEYAKEMLRANGYEV